MFLFFETHMRRIWESHVVLKVAVRSNAVAIQFEYLIAA